MTSQSIAGVVTMTRQLWRERVKNDVDFIHRDIHARSCKKYIWVRDVSNNETLWSEILSYHWLPLGGVGGGGGGGGVGGGGGGGGI